MHSQPHRRSKSVPSMYSSSGSQDNTEIQPPLRLRSSTDSGQRLVPSIRSKSRLSSGGLLRSQSKKRRSINGLEKSRSVDLHDERNNSTTAKSDENIQSRDDDNASIFPRRKHGVFSVNHLYEKEDITMDNEEDFHGDRHREQTLFVEGVCETESSDVGDQKLPLDNDNNLEYSRKNTDFEKVPTTEQNEQKQDILTDSENTKEQMYNYSKRQEDYSQFRRRSLPAKLAGLNMDFKKGHEQFKHISTENNTTCEEQELRKYNSMPSQLNKDNFDTDSLRKAWIATADKLKHGTLLLQDITEPDDNCHECHEHVIQKDPFSTTGEHLVDDNLSIQCVPNENMTKSEQYEQTNSTYSLSNAQKVMTHEQQLEKLAVSNHNVYAEHKDDKPLNNAMSKYKRARPKRQRRTKSLPALLDLEEVPEPDKEDYENVDKSLEDVARHHVNKAFHELLKRISQNQAKKARKQVRRTHSLSTIHEKQLEENEQSNEQSINAKLMDMKIDNENDNSNESMSNDSQLNAQSEHYLMENEQCRNYDNDSEKATEQNDCKETKINEQRPLCTNIDNANYIVEDKYGNNDEHLEQQKQKYGESREATYEHHNDGKTFDHENTVCEDTRENTASCEGQVEERDDSSQKEVISQQSAELQPTEKKKKKKKRKKKKKGKGAQARTEASVEEDPEADSNQGDFNGIHGHQRDGIQGNINEDDLDGNDGDLDENEGDFDSNDGDLNGIQGDLVSIQGHPEGIQGNLEGLHGELAWSPEDDSNQPESYPESDRMQHELCTDEHDAESESFPEADQLAPEDNGLQRNSYLDDEEARPEDEQSQNELYSEDDCAQFESFPEDDRQQSEPATEDDRQELELTPEDDLHAESVTEDARGEVRESHLMQERKESEFLPEDERTHSKDAHASEHAVEEQMHNEESTNNTAQSAEADWFVISIDTQEETATIDYHPEDETHSEEDDHSDIEIPQMSVSQVPVEKIKPIQINHCEKTIAVDEIDDPVHFHTNILEHVQSIDYTSLDTSMMTQRHKVLPTMESIDEDSADLTENTDAEDRHHTFKRTGSIRRKVLKGNMTLPLENNTTTAHATKRVTWSEDLIEAKSPDTPTSLVGDFSEETREEINEEDGDDDSDVVDGGQDEKEPQDFDDLVRNVINAYLEPNYKESQSPVHRAVARGCVDALMELIDDGVDVNADDEHGWPPLHVAMLTNNIECASILIEAGADLQQYTDTLIHEYYTVRNEVSCS